MFWFVNCCNLLLFSLIYSSFPVVNSAGQAALIFPGTNGITFVRALEVDPATGWRESASAACTRVGLLPTVNEWGVGPAASAPGTWDNAALAAAVASLGPAYTVASPPVAGCCSPGLWCRNETSSQSPPPRSKWSCFTHAPLGSSPSFVNYGWALDPTSVPVFSCLKQILPPSGVPGPGVYNIRVSPAKNNRLWIDGVRFGNDSAAIAVAVATATCTAPTLCSNLCAVCSPNDPYSCGPDKTCLKIAGAPAVAAGGICVAPCLSDNTCACGATCYSLLSPGSAYSMKICANAGISGSAQLCEALSAPFSPPPGDLATERLECTLAGLGVRGLTPAGPRSLLLSSPRVDDSALATLNLLDIGLLQERELSDALHRAAEASAAMEIDPPSLSTSSWQRRLQRGNKDVTVVPGAYLGGWRYGGACAAGGGNGSAIAPGVVPVVVTVSGRASSGPAGPWTALATAAAAAAAARPLDGATAASRNAALAALAALGYSGFVAPWANTTFECVTVSDCLMIDACSLPTCVLANASDGAGVSNAAAALRSGGVGGCCVYIQRPNGCDTTHAGPRSGDAPAAIVSLALPAAAAAALPMVPPPIGNASLRWDQCAAANPAAGGRGGADGGPLITVWDARSPWWDARGGGLNASFGGPTPWLFSPTSTVDDTPLEEIRLPWPARVLGAPLPGGANATVWLSANGYIRTVGLAPCNGTFTKTSYPPCDFSNDYNGVVAPLAMDFNPGGYAESEIWYARINAAPLASLLGNGTVLPSAASNIFCASFLAMGLFTQQDVFVSGPASPEFSFQSCVHADGAVRTRYGRILGAPGEAKNAAATAANDLPPEDSVGRVIGGPGGRRFLAGERSTGATFVSYEAARLVPASYRAPLIEGAPDWAVDEREEILLGPQGVRPGGSSATCTVDAIACASPACGGSGTSVMLQWQGASCGLGLEALSAAGGAAWKRTAGPPIIKLLCLFGAAPSSASWLSYNATTGVGFLTCSAPAQPDGFNGTVPLTLAAILPSDPSAYAVGGARVTAGKAGLLGTGLGIGPGGASLPLFSLSYGEVAVRLPVSGVEGIAWGNNNTLFVYAPRALTFTYAGTCNCSPAAPAATCGRFGICAAATSLPNTPAPPPPVDCAGTPFGAAYVDACGVCSAGASGHVPLSDVDCDGVCFGPSRGCQESPGGGSIVPRPPDENNSSQILLTTFAVFAAACITIAFIVCFFLTVWQRCREGGIGMDDIEMVMTYDVDFLRVLPTGLPPEARARQNTWNWAGKNDPRAADVPGGADSCSICMDDIKEEDEILLSLVPCSHLFHVTCIEPWFEKSTVCPVCRADLRTPAEVELMATRRRVMAEEFIRTRQAPPASSNLARIQGAWRRRAVRPPPPQVTRRPIERVTALEVPLPPETASTGTEIEMVPMQIAPSASTSRRNTSPRNSPATLTVLVMPVEEGGRADRIVALANPMELAGGIQNRTTTPPAVWTMRGLGGNERSARLAPEPI